MTDRRSSFKGSRSNRPKSVSSISFAEEPQDNHTLTTASATGQESPSSIDYRSQYSAQELEDLQTCDTTGLASKLKSIDGHVRVKPLTETK